MGRTTLNVLEFTALVFLVSGVAGFLGALTGLGGGVVITPALVLMLGVDLRYAIGATLVSVIATSSGAAAAYVREGFSNIRIGMFLEVATTLGAVAGAFLAAVTPASALAIVFGVVLLYSAIHSIKAQPQGIGSGAMKVIAMDQVMGIPFKVSTATSNFMIGVTAAASAGVYLKRGYIDPGLAMPVMLGVLAGSVLGARQLAGARTRVLRLVFGAVVGAMAVEMIYSGMTGKLR
jgi:uncharacterized membrane protein YfcA